jgi:putative sugar O-methyltransferase
MEPADNFDAGPLWQKYRKSFAANSPSDYRGYGINPYSNARRSLYLIFRTSVSLPYRLVNSLNWRIHQILLKIVSFLIFNGDAHAADRYGISQYNHKIYDEHLISQFKNRFSPYGIGISHNALKSFSYLVKLEKAGLNLNSPINVLEVGGGLFTFGHLFASSVKSFNYVVIDLPEVIIAAKEEIAKNYSKTGVTSYDVYDSKTIEKFLNSPSKRKVIFISNDESNLLIKLSLSFDLFVNHESFSEMNLLTVNSYLRLAKNHLASEGLVNLVNRVSRYQLEERLSESSTEQITNFDKYDLSNLKTKIIEICDFRGRIPSQNKHPNYFYIGLFEDVDSGQGMGPN